LPLDISSSFMMSSRQALSSSDNTPCVNVKGMNTITDCRDAKLYNTVLIGNQTWLAENLNFGDFIADSYTGGHYQIGFQKFCYDNIFTNCENDGGLYQWHTAMAFSRNCTDGTLECKDQISSDNHQGICLNGWHIPKIHEWDTLAINLGANLESLGVYTAIAKKLKLPSFGGDNSSGFSALGAGLHHIGNGFDQRTEILRFWEAREGGKALAGMKHLISTSDNFHFGLVPKIHALSVRCIKD
jgi:uncharacterized protein (TIGR02145 family)